jgi:hypothetical protein
MRHTVADRRALKKRLARVQRAARQAEQVMLKASAALVRARERLVEALKPD